MESKIDLKNIALETVHRLRENFEIPEDIFDLKEECSHHIIESSLRTAINQEANMLRLRLSISVMGQTKDNKEFPVKGDFCYDYHFKVKQLKKFAKLENEELVLDNEMMRILSSIAYSTSRGFIMTETDKTGILPCVILPIIEPANLLNGPDDNLIKMSNFHFLKASWPSIYREANEAESLAITSPKACTIICRSAMEKAVHWLYANDADLEMPYDEKLASLIHAQCFMNILKPSMFREINLIRKIGNNAAHGNSIKSEESLVAIKNLFRFLSFLAIYYAEDEPEIPAFEEALIPTGKEADLKMKKLLELEQKLLADNEKLRAERKELEQRAEDVEGIKNLLAKQEQEIKERKVERKEVVDEEVVLPQLVSESQTRKLYIDQSLKESGWTNLRNGYELEFEVKGMPLSTNKSGIGYADYVLWGDNGKPIAVIEAKKTLHDARKGQHQAKLYADCLEKMFGQRPIIYFTNGFDTHIWDDCFYPDRETSGFYSKDELQRAIDRRDYRLDIRDFKVNEDISGRYYQLEAVKRIAERFAKTDSEGQLTGGSRKALLVMATGSGKTRTAVSVVDMLTKCRWAKRVLFLADRNALVTQAKRNFGDLLPNMTSIDLTKEKEDAGTRLVFSTYPTIMNKIDQAKDSDGRFYSPGHFDLIIIDEAHRSVYQKYKAIFEYFDVLLVGLTATPKRDIDHNTYSLFDIEDHNPTFFYELDKAVRDQYLVPPRAFSVPLKFPREGIKYKDLSPQEQKEFEEKFGDPTLEETPDEIGGSALNEWLFNTSTVDKALTHLMEKGIKVEGGDKLGKTIIFAKNHNHAVFIEERFNKIYPEFRGDFLRVIDNQTTKAEDLLERFCDDQEEVNPQIAVSVDMMDTGVDAPRVVNLVFFKMIRSYTKFWQMIGRGTRLRKDLFGPGQHKEHFMILDFLGNLEFFEENPEGISGSTSLSLTERIFNLKVDIVMSIRELAEPTTSDSELDDIYVQSLHSLIAHLNQERFQVKAKLKYVEEYKNLSRWQNLGLGDASDLKNNISSIIIPDRNDHELARRFDVMILALTLARYKGKDGTNYIERISNVSGKLLTKKNIPAVSNHIELLVELQTETFWKNAQAKRLEEVRIAIRELMKFLDVETQELIYTSIEDEINEANIKEGDLIKGVTYSKPYKERVESYLRKNKNHLTIHKLRNNIAITNSEIEELEKILFDNDELGSKEDFEKNYGKQPLGKFIRSIVGMEIQAAKDAFGDFLQAGNLKADQITFVDNIISFLGTNGTISASMLFEAPFTDQNDQGILGVFEEPDAYRVIGILEGMEANAVVA